MPISLDYPNDSLWYPHSRRGFISLDCPWNCQLRWLRRCGRIYRGWTTSKDRFILLEYQIYHSILYVLDNFYIHVRLYSCLFYIISTFLTHTNTKNIQFLIQPRRQLFLIHKQLNIPPCIVIIRFREFRIILPIIILSNPPHHHLAIPFLIPLTFTQTQTCTTPNIEQRTPKTITLFDD